ncbi:hypothetical protein RQP46_008331 [Phenoliferia psychrophenolica]
MDPNLLAMMRQMLPKDQYRQLTSNPAMLEQLVSQFSSTSLASSFPTQSIEDIERQIKETKRRHEAEKRLPPCPAQAFPREMLIRDWTQQRKEQEKAEATPGAQMVYQTYCGIKKSFSQTPLSALQPVFLKDMLLRTTHTGKYLLARIVSPAVLMAAVTFVIEDQLGRAELCSIYNELCKGVRTGPDLDVLYPIGAIMAIREPTYKSASQGPGSLVRVDSPTDVIVIDPSHPLYSSNWKTSSPSRSLPTDWKSVGNGFFAQQKFRLAVRTYSRGIEAGPPPDVLLLHHLNRSAANLKIQAFRAAFRDAQRVLAMLDGGVPAVPTAKEKALNRRAQAEEGMQLYDRALESYTTLLEHAPDSVAAVEGRRRLAAKREQSRTGAYDWVKFFESGRVLDDSSRQDIADYVGPIRVTRVEGRGGGRGVFATRDILAGEVLLVEKAFACEFPAKGVITLSLDLQANLGYSGTQSQIVSTIIAKLRDDPSLVDVVNALYAGDDFPPPRDLPHSTTIYHNVDGPESCDINTARIEGVCSYNCFGGHAKVKAGVKNGPNDLGSASPVDSDSSTALFVRASLINHACAGSAFWQIFGDTIVVRARTSIKAGDEIFVPYVSPSAPSSDRVLKKHFPTAPCTCALCEGDRIDGPNNLKSRKKILERIPILQTSLRESYGRQRGPTPKDLRDTQALVKDLEGTYSSGRQPQLRLDLSQAYHLLAEATPLRHPADATKFDSLSLLSSGLELDLLPLSSSPSFKIRSLPFFEFDNSGAFFLAGAARSLEQGRDREAARWVAIAIEMEDMAYGGGKTMFKARYGDLVEKMAIRDFIERQL